VGKAKDEAIAKEEGREAAAKGKGRICVRCSAVVPFDDVEAKGPNWLCSYCRDVWAKDG
jgi:hypothetical protein